MTKPKKVGLALGGGAAKGLAHIGVIRVLEKAGIEISYIAGTSMGALIGGYYAATKDIAFLENLFLKIEHKDIYRLSHIVRKKDGELFKDRTVLEMISEQIKKVNIEDCKIPFSAIATDVENGDEIVLNSGNLYDAIQASTALPLIFKPATINGRLLMDGGFVNPVPADVVRKMGAEFVIAVDVSSRWENLETGSLNPIKVYNMIPQALSIIEYQIARRILKEADVVLTPPVLGYKMFQFDDAKEIIKCGENETKNKLRVIYKGCGTTPPQKKPLDQFLDFIFYSD